jgi:hypothetical protein
MWDDLLLVEKLETQPTVTPRIIEAQGGIKPDAGVAATRPDTQPEHCVEQSQLAHVPKQALQEYEIFPANHTPLPTQTIIQKDPSNSSKHGS